MKKSHLTVWLLPLLFVLHGCSSVARVSAYRPLTANDKAVRLAQIGALFESQGRTANALASYKKGLAIDPSNDRLETRIASLHKLPGEELTLSADRPVADAPRNNPEPVATKRQASLERAIQLSSWPQSVESVEDSELHENEESEFIPTEDSELIGRETPISAGGSLFK